MSQGTLRILTAVVGIPAVLAAVYAGTYWFGIVIGLIALVSAYEMGKLFESMDAGPVMLSGLLLSALVVSRTWFPYWEAAAVLVFSATVLLTPVLRGDRPAQRSVGRRPTAAEFDRLVRIAGISLNRRVLA